jgi:hypothetical protein
MGLDHHLGLSVANIRHTIIQVLLLDSLVILLLLL